LAGDPPRVASRGEKSVGNWVLEGNIYCWPEGSQTLTWRKTSTCDVPISPYLFYWRKNQPFVGLQKQIGENTTDNFPNRQKLPISFERKNSFSVQKILNSVHIQLLNKLIIN